MRVRAVLFDHDGTLVDSEPIHYRLWATLLADHGVELTAGQYKAHYAGMPTPANATDIVERFGLAEAPARLIEQKEALTRSWLAARPFPLMPGAIDVVRALHARGLPLAVVTGAGRHGVEATLGGHGLDQWISGIVSGDDVRHSKPAPDCYLLAARRLGVEPAACITFEDTAHGLRAAAAAGVRCLAVPTEYSRHHDFSQAEAVFDSLLDASTWLTRLIDGTDGTDGTDRAEPR